MAKSVILLVMCPQVGIKIRQFATCTLTKIVTCIRAAPSVEVTDVPFQHCVNRKGR